MTLEEDLQALCGATKLERDRAETRLRALAPQLSDAELMSAHAWASETLARPQAAWEELFGALTATQVLLSLHTNRRDLVEAAGLTEGVLRCLEHPEFRVRIAAGEALGVLCGIGGLEVFRRHAGLVKAGIRDHLERQEAGEEPEEESSSFDSSSPRSASPNSLREKLSSSEIFHDTAGWKSLETWMRCLQCMVKGLPEIDLELYEDLDFFALLFDALRHTNRFVRETGYGLLGATAEATKGRVHTMEIAKQLHDGLADNWSQVRMAASVATRQFLSAYGLLLGDCDEAAAALPSDPASVTERARIWDLLLPAMCLNRYYIAEGVRLYSHESWRLAAGGRGREMVAAHLDATVAFYLTQADADNHAVREAACSCIAELASKVDRAAVEPQVGPLLEALLVCFKDESWPVRDAACLACGNFAAAFPAACAPLLDRLLPLFWANLRDGVPSVRHGAAAALQRLVEAFEADAERRGVCTEAVLGRVPEGLAAVKAQPQMSSAHSSVDASQPGAFGVVPGPGGAGIDPRCENQTMYSCGSLAPKMKKGSARKGGCHDGSFSRPAEPWEVTDGFVHLVAELASLPTQRDFVRSQLPALAEAAHARHFSHHVYLLESVLRCLPRLAAGLGPRAFKTGLEPFLEPLAYGVEAENGLTAAAAKEAVRDLARLLGPNILRGRIELSDPSLLPKLAPFIM